jgi:hypothetical protein
MILEYIMRLYLAYQQYEAVKTKVNRAVNPNKNRKMQSCNQINALPQIPNYLICSAVLASDISLSSIVATATHPNSCALQTTPDP